MALATVSARAVTYTFGVTNLVVGPSAGTNSIVLAVSPKTSAWTAMSDAGWLHLASPFISASEYANGTGSTNLVFTFDANPGPTRTATITVSNATLTVTQAGAGYVSAAEVAILVPVPGVVAGFPPTYSGMTVDRLGNVYTMETDLINPFDTPSSILEWTASNNASIGRGSDSQGAQGLAVDGSGNVYMADTGDGDIKKWVASSDTFQILATGLDPLGLALDGAGNLYIADGSGAIEVRSSPTGNISSLVSSGLSSPQALALDAAGNVYIADTGNGAIKEWLAGNSNVITLVTNSISPSGVAVDGSGNVYFTEGFDENGNGGQVKVWSAASGGVSVLVPGAWGYGTAPTGIAVDALGNVYFANYEFGIINELPAAYVDTAMKLVSPEGGIDTLPPVLPANENLLPPFRPSSDNSNWCDIVNETGGSVEFLFYPGAGNKAHISVLGQSVPVVQGAFGTSTTLMSGRLTANGGFKLAFTNVPDAYCEVYTTTSAALPWSQWSFVGAATEISPGVYQYATWPQPGEAQRYYMVQSP